MQKEPLFIPNTKFVFLDKLHSNIFKIRIPNTEEIRYIKDVGVLGIPFFMITKKSLEVLGNDYSDHPFKHTQEFKDLYNPFSPLDNYLREAQVEFTLSKRDDGKTQYFGLAAGVPLNVESMLKIGKKEHEYKMYAVPCHFYLINDNLNDLRDILIKPPIFCPTV